jgi:cytidylate kinase
VIIAIDGPAGSGKSSTAKAVAKKLGFRHLDSGAFYRALTYAALQSGMDPETWEELRALSIERLGVEGKPGNDGFHFFLHGSDITGLIRSPEVNAHVSTMARVPAVRRWLLGQLRTAGKGGDLVADGRDMGTAVFPQAQLKVFLTADLSERARRRLAENGNRDPSKEDLEEETKRLAARDKIDSEREESPLKQADDAIPIDTTGVPFHDQVEVIVRLARSRAAR